MKAAMHGSEPDGRATGLAHCTIPRPRAADVRFRSTDREPAPATAAPRARSCATRRAEDAVSETVLAALERPQSFGGNSQLKTWLVGIPSLGRGPVAPPRAEATVPSARTARIWTSCCSRPIATGARAARLGRPRRRVQPPGFIEVLQACCEHLPPCRRVFMMREWLGSGPTRSAANSGSARATCGCCCTARGCACAVPAAALVRRRRRSGSAR